ncbi:hypothetical protein BKA67DRAFT_655755 [Truncatella angustata]|uniref:C2H2-type domain-containing protein n=1 Tax=Truncatella angustata TaxID=152316 RepID=A0A9P8USV4_9PEZI|nr:uncharacterized protein BKA67DRAFT_655755 [Truncatella angustata]KAH6657487.1 hypothetical protein BKA67DRAFT_655755 [Truncatella angustata]
MDGPVDHNGHSHLGYDSLTAVNSVDKYLHSGTGSHSHSHDSTCHDAADFGSDFLAAFAFDNTVEPSTLQVSHTSHDDSCVDQCPGSYNAQGLPRGTFPAAPHPRQRFTTSLCSFPYVTEAPFLQPPAQHFHQAHAYFPVDSEFKFPVNHAARYMNHPLNNGQHYSTPLNAPGICTMSQCDVVNDCVSGDCRSVMTCSEGACCTDPSCADASCEDLCDGDVICHGEACADLGDTCDDTLCLTSPPSASAFDSMGWTQDFGGDWNFHQYPGHGPFSHNPACNHTIAEHDVAITLRHLKDPAAPSQQQQQHHAFLGSFDSDQFIHGDTEVASTIETPTLTADHATSPMSHRPSLSSSGSKDASGQHVCRWLVKSKGDIHAHICGETFQCNEDLHTHLGKDHVGQMSSKTKYICLWEGCSRKDDQVFASRNKLRRHISTHTSFKPFKCPHCKESFSAQQALDQHIRIHTGERPYKCDYAGCDKAFKQKSALTMHKRTHTGEKPLTCEICGKSFCESSNLSKHRKIHNADYKFKCTHCPRSFIRVDQLRRHQQKHDREKEKGKGRVLEPSIPEDDLEADCLHIVNEQFLDV